MSYRADRIGPIRRVKNEQSFRSATAAVSRCVRPKNDCEANAHFPNSDLDVKGVRIVFPRILLRSRKTTAALVIKQRARFTRHTDKTDIKFTICNKWAFDKKRKRIFFRATEIHTYTQK